MQITRLGDYCFKVRSKKKNILLGSPLEVEKKVKADLVIAPHQELDKNSKIEGKIFLINAPGEYEVDGVSVFAKKEFYVFDVSGIRLCFLVVGEGAEFKLSGKKIDELENIDILFVKLSQAFDATKAHNFINQIQPSLLIPSDSEEVDKLLNKLGMEDVKLQDKLSLTKKGLPEEEMEVAVLKKQ